MSQVMISRTSGSFFLPRTVGQKGSSRCPRPTSYAANPLSLRNRVAVVESTGCFSFLQALLTWILKRLGWVSLTGKDLIEHITVTRWSEKDPRRVNTATIHTDRLLDWVKKEAIVYGPGPLHIDQNKVDTLLSQLFLELHASRVKKVRFSKRKEAALPEDFTVGATGKSLYTYFCERAARNKIRVHSVHICDRRTIQRMQASLNPDADKIYNQYIDYYNQINTYITTINGQYPAPQPTNVRNDINDLVAVQMQLYPICTTDMNNPNATLASFQADCAALMNQAFLDYQDAMGGGTIHDKIVRDAQTATTAISALETTTAQDAAAVNNFQSQSVSIETLLADLKTQIDALPDGDQKTKALSDFAIAQTKLSSFQALLPSLNTRATILSQDVDAVEKGPENSDLQALANLPNPQEQDLTQAEGDLVSIQSALATISSEEQTTFQPALQSANTALAAVNSAVAVVQRDLHPTPVGKVENACWYIDWTAWDFPVPEGVTTVNLFVGNLTVDSSGNLVVGGFGNMDQAKMQTFIQACQAQGITVKISIGGGGGSYDNCWNVLTDANVESFGQQLSSYCQNLGLQGVDFDCEEFHSATDNPAQQALVGRFIKAFKRANPELQTSLCTNAGFGDSYPWQGIVQNIMDAATDSSGCALDRLYIMSYYNDIASEQAWILAWAAWAKTRYNLSAAQITFGIDDFDAHAYNIADMARWAGQQGFSTGYWATNPATIAQSNQSTTTIKNAYDG